MAALTTSVALAVTLAGFPLSSVAHGYTAPGRFYRPLTRRVPELRTQGKTEHCARDIESKRVIADSECAIALELKVLPELYL